MARNNGFKRKCVLIDRDFQFTYMLTWIAMTMTLLGGLLLASVTMFFIFKVQTVNHLVIGNAVSAVLMTVLSMRYMIRFSHRIAGPAFRLERTLREVADGGYEGHVRLRKKDYLKHVADSVNYLIDKRNADLAQLAELHRCADQVQMLVDLSDSSNPELRRLTCQLTEGLADLSKIPTEADETSVADDVETPESVELEEVSV